MEESPPSPDTLARREAYEEGLDAESFVAAWLSDEGWQIVERNWRGGGAEVDLIVRRGPSVRFVEVKARQAGDSSGLESIGSVKQGKLRRAARAWWSQHDAEEVCFMVALVTLGTWELELLDDAF